MQTTDGRDYFEQLVALRLRPVHPDDRRSVISIEDVALYAEAAMIASELELQRRLEAVQGQDGRPASTAIQRPRADDRT